MIKEKAMSWYIVRTQSNKERSVVEKLSNELSRTSLGDKVGKILVPTEKEFHIKDGKRIVKEKIIFPGYVFIQTKACGELSTIFKNINGTSGFLKSKDGSPQKMKDIEVAKMLKDQDMVDSKEIESSFIVNEIVQIIDGPFSSFKASIEVINDEKQKLKVSVSIFGKKTMIDLNFLQVEKVLD